MVVQFPIYIYNTTTATLYFSDIGLELPSHDYFEIDESNINGILKTGNQLDIAIGNGNVVITKISSAGPPAPSDIFASTDATKILSEEVFALEVNYDDTNTSLGVQTVQAAIEALSSKIVPTTNIWRLESGSCATGTLTYSLSNTPVLPEISKVDLNGVMLDYGVEFSISGNQLTFIEGGLGYPIETGDTFQISYVIQVQPWNNDLINCVDGINTYSLSGYPTSPTTAKLNLNGLELKNGIDFTVSGNQVIINQVNLGYLLDNTDSFQVLWI